jgi:NTE family protein
MNPPSRTGAPGKSWCAALLSLSALALTFLSGCASYGGIENVPSAEAHNGKRYDLDHFAKSRPCGDTAIIVSFSGGGTRAAGMAYGVLEELRDTVITVDGRQQRLLDEVDHISSVSGGSFTSAYYGLHGDKIFEDFEDDFLRANIQKHLVSSLLNPAHWFGHKGRTERAIEYYQKVLFHDATFADMMQPGRPMIVINASDLGEGVRFSFIQDYFDLLSSDLLSFPVARAVAASSAVPVVLNPVVVENYPGGGFKWPPDTAEQVKQNAEFASLYEGLSSYSDKKNRKYIHFVDGGITDNIGLRAVSDVIALSGGPGARFSKAHRKPPSRVVLLSVNASTKGKSTLDESRKQPSILTAINAVTDVQLHRYNADTEDLARRDLQTWAAKLSTSSHRVTPYFIQVSFEGVAEPQLKLFLNKIPTSFDLTDEQVDAVIKSARTLLRADPQFQKLRADLARS